MIKGLEYNLNFDDPTPEETERQQEMAEWIELLERYGPLIDSEPVDPKYQRFIAATESSQINVERIFEDIPTKKRIIREVMGYTALTGRENKAVRLEEAKDARIGKVYLDIYNRARRLTNQ